MSRVFYFYLSMVIEIKYSVGDFEQVSRFFFFIAVYRKHFHPTSSCENSKSLVKSKKEEDVIPGIEIIIHGLRVSRIIAMDRHHVAFYVTKPIVKRSNDPRSRNYCYSYFLTLRQTSKGISLRLTVESSDWTLPDNGILM